MGVQVFTDLLIWQRSRQWSKAIFAYTKRKPFARDRRLVLQINDSSASVMANIAEGFGRGTQGEFVQFIGYALGSLNETQSHWVVAYDREYVTKEEYAPLFAESIEIRRMTVSFLTKMVMQGSGVKNLGTRKVRKAYDVWEMVERVTGKPRPEMFRTPETVQ